MVIRKKIYWIIVLFLVSCSSGSQKQKEGFGALQGLGNESLELSGQELSDLYCQACHIKTDPGLLDKATWKKSVLPDMRRRLGLINEEDFGAKIGEDNDAPPGIYSSTPLVTQADWNKIQEFYLSQAPDSLASIPEDKNLIVDPEIFKLTKPGYRNKRPSLTTLVRFHPEEKLLYLGDRLNSLFRINPKTLEIVDSIRIKSPASDIMFRNSGFELLTMGVMDPSNFALGRLEEYGSFNTSVNILIDSLKRPVHFSYADLRYDNKEDVIISSFGNHVGTLSRFEKDLSGSKEHVLNSNPGTRKTVLDDVNGDGLPDIIALMTQANEGIYAYINLGNGKFKEEIWLRFPAVFGSSDFEWVDMDGDGYKDLVIVNGDNADLSPILKPYHGLRIYSNDGKNAFQESYFYPMHGASAVLTGDFDQSGKPSIAVISYFPDKSSKNVVNFLFFRHVRDMRFEVSSFKELGEWSWLVMDKADIDGDGDLDIVLGNFDFQTRYSFPPMDWMPFLFLENQMIKK